MLKKWRMFEVPVEQSVGKFSGIDVQKVTSFVKHKVNESVDKNYGEFPSSGQVYAIRVDEINHFSARDPSVKDLGCVILAVYDSEALETREVYDEIYFEEGDDSLQEALLDLNAHLFPEAILLSIIQRDPLPKSLEYHADYSFRHSMNEGDIVIGRKLQNLPKLSDGIFETRTKLGKKHAGKCYDSQYEHESLAKAEEHHLRELSEKACYYPLATIYADSDGTRELCQIAPKVLDDTIQISALVRGPIEGAQPTKIYCAGYTTWY